MANYGELRSYDRGPIKLPLILIRKKKCAGEAKTMCALSPIREISFVMSLCTGCLAMSACSEF